MTLLDRDIKYVYWETNHVVDVVEIYAQFLNSSHDCVENKEKITVNIHVPFSLESKENENKKPKSKAFGPTPCDNNLPFHSTCFNPSRLSHKVLEPSTKALERHNTQLQKE